MTESERRCRCHLEKKKKSEIMSGLWERRKGRTESSHGRGRPASPAGTSRGTVTVTETENREQVRGRGPSRHVGVASLSRRPRAPYAPETPDRALRSVVLSP